MIQEVWYQDLLSAISEWVRDTPATLTSILAPRVTTPDFNLGHNNAAVLFPN